MIAEHERKLHEEVNVGAEYQQAWDRFVEPFFTAKQEELYKNFLESEVSDIDRMKAIVHQSKALTSLHSEFASHIITGRMAKHTLKEEKNDN